MALECVVVLWSVHLLHVDVDCSVDVVPCQKYHKCGNKRRTWGNNSCVVLRIVVLCCTAMLPGCLYSDNKSISKESVPICIVYTSGKAIREILKSNVTFP